MKKILPNIAGVLLGLMFIMAGMLVLLKMAPTPKFPEGSPIALFMGAFGPTGYMTFIKILEVLGGVLVAVPRTRGMGLLILGPIIVNILAFHAFITAGEGLFAPMLLVIVGLTLYLVWVERSRFGPLLGCCSQATPS